MKFNIGQLVRHKGTGNIYKIIMSPHESGVIIEETGEGGYVYFRYPDGGRTIWVRSYWKMEDGRFEEYKE